MKIDITSYLTKLQPLWRYRMLLFIVFVAGLSGYLVMQINQAISVPASTETSVAPSQNRATRIDPVVVQQLKQLEDNSVSVKSLFNQGRENPFQ